MRTTAVLVSAGLGLAALIFGPAPVQAGPAKTDKDRTETGRTLSGNYLAGRHAQAQRDLSAAADFLGAALKQTPDAPGLLHRTFILLTVEGRITEAEALARRLVKANPKMTIAHLVLAATDIKQGRFAAARKRLGKMPEKSIGGFAAPVLRAWSLMGMKKSKAALKLLAAEPKEKAAKVLHLMHRALINEMLGRNDLAEKHYLAVNKDQNGGSLRVVQLLGELYERTARPEKARTLYQNYLKDKPGSQLLDVALKRLKAGRPPGLKVFSVSAGAAEAFFSIASSLRRQNAQEMGLALGRLALYLKPNFPVLQILMGDILEAVDRLEPALEVYSSISPTSAFSWPARLRITSLLNRLDRTDEAVGHLNRMAKDQTDDPGPLISLGDILRGRERFEEAVVAYDQAFKRIQTLEERHWSLLYTRAIALERSKQWPRAEADFLSALKFKPEQPYVLNYLGYSWIDKGIYLDRAQKMISKAASLRPNDGFIIDSLGWGYYRLGDFEKAVPELERAVELRPQDPIINDHLGDAYWRVGRRREAVFQWKRSLSLDPEEDVVTKIKRKLKVGLGDDTETAKKPGNDG